MEGMKDILKGRGRRYQGVYVLENVEGGRVKDIWRGRCVRGRGRKGEGYSKGDCIKRP